MENGGSEAPVVLENSDETPVLPGKTAGETPVPQLYHGLL
jgi:hypothetical protein